MFPRSLDVALISTMTPQLKIDSCKLHLITLKTQWSTGEVLNKSLQLSPKSYIINKTLYKTYVIFKNQMQLSIDMPWESTIPEKIYVYG